MLNNFSWQTGHSDFAKLSLTTPNGASAEIYRYGAHLTSWKTRSGREWMFLSSQSLFEQGKAIRGGVPVIFPQFSGFGPGPRHGFARNMEWRLSREPHNGSCTFLLEADESSLAAWPYKFHAEFTPTLADDQLTMTLLIRNIDDKPFTFTAALHTYFAVSNVHQVELSGLEGLTYWDNNGSDFHKDRFVQKGNSLNFPGAIDRVYFACTGPLQLTDGNHKLSIQAEGFRDVVVWNPGADAAKNLSDLADDEYQKMLCVEAAVVDQPITLAPGEVWSRSQILKELS